MQFKVGSKIRWMNRRHHVIGFAQDGDHDLLVTKYWAGSRLQRWEYAVVPVWLYREMMTRTPPQEIKP
ncbi:hypothetical protein [Marilutibacter alkalisoli]|nr:hypothetical protein [Lysobacter alkalisoli]